MANLLDSEMGKTFRFLFFTPGNKEVWGLPALYRAEPGTAKTSMSRAMAKVMGLEYHMLSPGLHGDGATGVVPVPAVIDGRTYLTFPAPIWVKKFRDQNDKPIPGVLVVDELLTAQGGQRAPLLAAIDERTIGECFLGSTVRVIGFTNDADACGTDDLSPQLANRFLHPTWNAPDVATTAEHLLSGTELSDLEAELDPVAEQKRVMALWPEYRSNAATLVAKYLRAKPDDLHVQPKLGSPNASRGWPSRRSWEMAVRVIAGTKLHRLDDSVTSLMLEATLGADVAATFIEFARKLDLPNPVDVLDGKVNVLPLDPRRLDRTYAILDSCAAFCADPKAAKRKERGTAFWKILGDLYKVTPDMVLEPAQRMVKGGNIDPVVALPVLANMKGMTDIYAKVKNAAK